jgi:hypothetical protein
LPSALRERDLHQLLHPQSSQPAMMNQERSLCIPLNRHHRHQLRQCHSLWLPPVQDHLHDIRRQQLQLHHIAYVGAVHRSTCAMWESSDGYFVQQPLPPNRPAQRRHQQRRAVFLAWPSAFGRVEPSGKAITFRPQHFSRARGTDTLVASSTWCPVSDQYRTNDPMPECVHQRMPVMAFRVTQIKAIAGQRQIPGCPRVPTSV